MVTVTTRQRHTAAEIATKLALADEMAAKGRLHGDIAKSLGISVMTYHRWRKARRLTNGAPHSGPDHPGTTAAVAEAREPELAAAEQMIDIRELRLENLRLRRLVTDLLLEKDKLQEDLRATMTHRRAAQGIRHDV